MSNQSSDMTLAFTVDALRELADPAAAVEAARRWTTQLGVVADPPNAGLEYTSIQQIETDFFSGTRTIEETLSEIAMSYDTERYVLVGTTEADEQTATTLDWEYRDIETAAELADWELADDGTGEGVIDRFLPF